MVYSIYIAANGAPSQLMMEKTALFNAGFDIKTNLKYLRETTSRISTKN